MMPSVIHGAQQMRKVVLVYGVLAAALFSGSANADPNLVLNPGFEADYCSACATSQASPPTDWPDSTGNSGDNQSDPNSGDMNAFLGAGTLTQTITGLVPTATYAVEFYVSEDPDLFLADNHADVLTVSLGPDTLDTIFGDDASFPNPPAYLFEGPFTDVATSTSEALTFSSNAIDGEWYIDDVSLVCDSAACAAATAVPEPNSLALLVVGLLGFGAYEVKRRRNRTVG